MEFIVPGRGRRPLPAVFAAVLMLLVVVLAGCGKDDSVNEPHEAFANVEVDYARAIRASTAEVTGSELVSLELTRPESADPVWVSRVATQQGEVHTVRVDAVLGDVLGTSTAGTGTDGLTAAELTARLDEATVLPDEAAREARGSTDGPVTAIRLDQQGDTVVWAVDVAGLQGEETKTHVVDARTGEVLRRG
ncbi:PepSY domain-containing protein [Streptomyces sp. TRM64462]|uniref:PepSY domain-containing protein n=1 Tax=Streptomyces sp. TRM64462 TaxID=2741726 RepID=UPI00158616D3|nr:hypothetical protein [Streptomyces sp. TRM64462]